jgi:cation diffusion facilitator CzcD-associated flavoprotein CzcO
MEKVADDFGLRDYFKLNHEIIGARWDATSSHWIITIRRNGNDNEVFEDWCDFFVNGSGKQACAPVFVSAFLTQLPQTNRPPERLEMA